MDTTQRPSSISDPSSVIQHLEQLFSETSDTEARIDILLKLSHVSQEESAKTALKYAMKALRYAQSADNLQRIAHSHYKIGEALCMTGDLQKALAHYAHSYRSTVRFNKAKASLIGISMASIHVRLSQYDKALELYQKGLKGLEEDTSLPPIKVQEGNVTAYTNIARLFRKKGDFVSAMEYVHKALRYCQGATKDWMIHPLLVAGSICLFLKDYERAIIHFKHGLELSRTAGTDAISAQCLLYLSRIAIKTADASSALSYQRLAAQCIEGKNIPHLRALSLLLAGKIHHHWSHYDSARDCYRRCADLFTKLQNPDIYGEAWYGLCLIEREEGNLTEAINGLHQLLDLTTENEFESNQMDCCRELARTYEMAGDKENALTYHKQFHMLNEKISGMQSQREIARIQLDNFFASQERTLKEREQNLEILSRELEAREQRLAEITLALAQKVAAQEDSAEAGNGKARGHASLDDLPDIEKLKENMETPWSLFERRFERVHIHFTHDLLHLHPKITPAELRVCCLLRSGLSSKESATLLSLSVGSVEVYRHRIRKKLKLPTKSNLVSYLSSL